MVNAKNLLVDGKRPGDVTEFSITWVRDEAGNEIRTAFIKYTVDGKERKLTVEAEAVSFRA